MTPKRVDFHSCTFREYVIIMGCTWQPSSSSLVDRVTAMRYTLLKPKRHSLRCHGFMVHALLLRMHTNVVCFQSYAKTVPSRMKLTMKLTLREPASMTTHTWSRRVTSDFNSVYATSHTVLRNCPYVALTGSITWRISRENAGKGVFCKYQWLPTPDVGGGGSEWGTSITPPDSTGGGGQKFHIPYVYVYMNFDSTTRFKLGLNIIWIWNALMRVKV